MKLLFDTNVVLDLLLDREPFSTQAGVLFSLVESGSLVGYLSATTVTTVFYLAERALGGRQARKEVEKLLALLEIAPVTRTVLESALNSGFTDYEDGVIHEAARSAGAEGIVTRNGADFTRSQVPVYAPEQLCAMLEAQGGDGSLQSGPDEE